LLFGLITACSPPDEPQTAIRPAAEQAALRSQPATLAGHLPERLRAFLTQSPDYRLMVFDDLGEFWKMSYSPGKWKSHGESGFRPVSLQFKDQERWETRNKRVLLAARN